MTYRPADYPDLGQEVQQARLDERRRRACTLDEVGTSLGVTKVRARQIEQKERLE